MLCSDRCNDLVVGENVLRNSLMFIEPLSMRVLLDSSMLVVWIVSVGLNSIDTDILLLISFGFGPRKILFNPKYLDAGMSFACFVLPADDSSVSICVVCSISRLSSSSCVFVSHISLLAILKRKLFLSFKRMKTVPSDTDRKRNWSENKYYKIKGFYTQSLSVW